MKTYNKRILLSVTGMSPAVVTETLYALVTDKEKPFIPTEIQVITTLQGKNKVLEALCGIVGGRKNEQGGALDDFIRDYGKKYGFDHIHFDESCIHIIEDEKGEKLPDIRTPKENELAADQIVGLVGKMCQDEDSQLHVSIAGGRKTMGFFMGYALSLYGREQDSLSHVLVSEAFETLPTFFYPKPYLHIINDRQGKELDASKAEVMLAEIPWVRLGLGLPKHLQDQKVTYSESVSKAQEMLKTPKIQFLPPIESRELRLGDNTVVKLSHRGYAFFLALVLMKKKGLEFSLENEDEIKRLFVDIYDLLSIKELPSAKDFDGESIAALESFKTLIAGARNDVVKKVQDAFYMGKGVTTPYIPSAARKKGLHYELLIDFDDEILRLIKSDIVHLL